METTSIYRQVLSNIAKKASTLGLSKIPSLLAVSKTKPVEMIEAIYKEGQRDFGENYANEIIEKSQVLPQDINWYMQGPLQSNKAKKLLEVKNLKAIISINSLKKAQDVNKACNAVNREIDIFVQINISGEESKNGLKVEETLEEAEKISKLERLRLKGIMSLGEIGNVEQFKEMAKLKAELEDKLGYSLEMSMGTSNDYETAIEHGSTQVRVGSTIFGAREYKN